MKLLFAFLGIHIAGVAVGILIATLATDTDIHACDHKFSRWGEIQKRTQNDFLPGNYQFRTCAKCGLAEKRRI